MSTGQPDSKRPGNRQSVPNHQQGNTPGRALGKAALPATEGGRKKMNGGPEVIGSTDSKDPLITASKGLVKTATSPIGKPAASGLKGSAELPQTGAPDLGRRGAGRDVRSRTDGSETKDESEYEWITVQRQHTFSEMTRPLQQVAITIQQKRNELARRSMRTAFEIGNLLCVISNAEHIYGTEAAVQVAGYLGLKAGPQRLFDYKTLARVFQREFIEQEAGIPMANGQYLTVQHFAALARVYSEEDRQSLLDRVRKESLTPDSLRRVIAARTRSPRRKGGRGRGQQDRLAEREDEQ